MMYILPRDLCKTEQIMHDVVLNQPLQFDKKKSPIRSCLQERTTDDSVGDVIKSVPGHLFCENYCYILDSRKEKHNDGAEYSSFCDLQKKEIKVDRELLAQVLQNERKQKLIDFIDENLGVKKNTDHAHYGETKWLFEWLHETYRAAQQIVTLMCKKSSLADLIVFADGAQ